jgi:IrrE N-terminal-like domain
LRREARVAERLIHTRSLNPPIDIHRVAEEFADVEYTSIPTNCDGLVVGLGRRKPLVLVDNGQHETRQRFTLAHELGHILLPWHIGNFACDTGQAKTEAAWANTDDEPEANGFAAELLVPAQWLDELIAERGDERVGPLTDAVLASGVSTWVTCFRLVERLPSGHVYAVVDSAATVLHSGQTELTGIDPPNRGRELQRARLDAFASQIEEITFGTRTIIWWTFRDGEGDFVAPPGDSRDLLLELARRYATPSEPVDRIRQRCGGAIGYAFGLARKEGETSNSQLRARFRGRFARTRENFPPGLLADPDFDRWISMRAAELGN